MSRDVVTAVRIDASRAREILVLDSSENVLRGLERLFREAGLMVTTLADAERARDQIANRFFSVALIDLDTPSPGAGLEWLQFCKTISPLTSVIVMTGRPVFDAVAPAFRAGAADVVPKTKEAIPYLRDRVIAAAGEIRTTVTRDHLLAEVTEVHEHFLKVMMELSRRNIDLEDRLSSVRRDDTTAIEALVGPVELLVVDDDEVLPRFLTQRLAGNEAWRVRVVQSGGEALDGAMRAVPSVVVVKASLPDLPGTMVVKSIKTTAPETVALLFTPPGGGGEVSLVEGSRLTTIIPSFTEPQQLLAALEEVRQALRRKVKERRYMQAFRKEHFDFLKRYNQIKQRLAQSKALG